MKTIAELLTASAENWHDKDYITHNGNTHTFSQFYDDVRSTARYLSGRFGKNCVCAVYAENSYEWLVVYVALIAYSGVCMPIDKEWTEHDLGNTIAAIKPNAVIYSDSTQEKARLALDGASDVAGVHINDILSEAESYADTEISPITDLEKTVMLIFTSGTTSAPKVIPLTQKNMLANGETLLRRTPMDNSDLTCIFLPLNHVYTCISNFLYTLISGLRIYICADIKRYTEDILRMRPDIICTVPLLLNKWYENMNDTLLDCLRNMKYIYCSASALDPEIKRYFRENGVPLIESYGASETSGAVSLDLVGETDLNCCGTVFENLDQVIDSPDSDGFGEILVRGDSITHGYLGCDCNSRYFDANGCYHTGDIGRLGDGRKLYFKGRIRRLLDTSSGKNIYADELEKMIADLGVCSKVRVSLENKMITAKIYTELTKAEVSAVIDEMNSRLPKYKRIQDICICRDEMGMRIK